MNRKKYGKVKPVKQAKLKPKAERPSTMELRSIYSHMKKCATWQIPDALAEAILWYRRLHLYFLDPALDKLSFMVSPSMAKLAIQREKYLVEARKPLDSEDKIFALTVVIKNFEVEAAKLGVKVPLLHDSLKSAKKKARKMDERKQKIERRFDKLLTMLAAASNLDVDLAAMPVLLDCNGEETDWKLDPTLRKVVFSRDALVNMKKRIRAEGILPVFIEKIFLIARARAILHTAGDTKIIGYIDHANWVTFLARGMKNLCEWLATSQDAPSRLVKRKVPKKKREKKVKAPEATPMVLVQN
jgi:hypothetical protein